MNKRTTSVDWTIAASDAEWERLPPPLSDSEPVAHHRLHLKRYFWSVAALFLLLVGVGGWEWQTTQAALPQSAADATVMAQSELGAVAPGPGSMSMLWGAERSLETPYFVYHFRQHDALAVVTVLPQMDALVRVRRRNFGLPIIPDAEKLVVDVSVTQPSGQSLPWFGAPDRISVPSPALYQAPIELTDAELLAQSIVLPLLEQVLVQASEQHKISSAWQPMLDGLRLWQMWDLDMPLAAWREEIVQWLYVDLPAVGAGQSFVLPEHYTALCAAHKLWLSSPAQINIPLICADLDLEYQYFSSWIYLDPPTRLHHIKLPMPQSYRYEEMRHEGQTVALATLIEYAVATYGRERLPALVAGLGQYESWDTLLPAVYGVSPAEFEAGWQAYLKEHYGIISAN